MGADAGRVEIRAVSTHGHTHRVAVPLAVKEKVDAAMQAGAVIGFSTFAGFTGERHFGRRIKILHDERGHHPYVIYAGFHPKQCPDPPVPTSPPMAPVLRSDLVYLSADEAIRLLACLEMPPPKPGRTLALPTGATLERAQGSLVLRPWILSGTVTTVELTLIAGKLKRPNAGPGPGLYQYAVTTTDPDRHDRHTIIVTNDRRRAEGLVRRFTPPTARDVLVVILSGIFRRGQRSISHNEYLKFSTHPGVEGAPVA